MNLVACDFPFRFEVSSGCSNSDMAKINVTCPSCMKRFEVSQKFAGKSGPCPACKKTIKIPEKKEEVVVHEPEIGPRDATGKRVLAPVLRQESTVSAPVLVGIGLGIAFAIAAAIVFRLKPELAEKFRIVASIAGAIILAAPIVYGTYTFLRDQELGAHKGKELWVRILSCAAGYALLWVIFPIAKLAMNIQQLEPTPIVVCVAVMVAVGAGIALAALEFEYLMGLVHYGMYFGVCLLLYFIAFNALPWNPVADAPASASALVQTLTTNLIAIPCY